MKATPLILILKKNHHHINETRASLPSHHQHNTASSERIFLCFSSIYLGPEVDLDRRGDHRHVVADHALILAIARNHVDPITTQKCAITPFFLSLIH